jgi:hypothetical protein
MKGKQMKKLLFLLFICAVVFSISANAFAKAYRVDENTLKWGPGPDPTNPANQVWYTYNDWTWVAGSLQLDSAWPTDPNTWPWPDTPFNAALMGLQITGPAQVDGSLVVPTGYQFDLASAGITSKVISRITIVNAYWNYPTGPLPVAPTFYDEDNNRVYRGNPAIGWWANVEIDFSNYPTKKVKFVLDPAAGVWIWPGNLMYLEQVTMTLVNTSEAKCGTKYKLSPLADLNQDCIVDFADVAILAQYWLKCNDPVSSPNCVH